MTGTMRLAENITALRRSRGVTQEELADFIGVTKASVSKWENGQSMPDILLLPLLAAYFDVSVDALIGYEPQLGREQMQKIYRELAADFASKPFEQVMEKTRTLTKQYYSCYPFLFQMAALWLNHFMLAGDTEKQQEVLGEALALCGHILENCRDIGICSDTTFLRASILLLLGKADEVVETMEEVLNPYRLSGQSDTLLIQAYQMSGQREKADSFAQITMFRNLMTLVSGAAWRLELNGDNAELCEETIRRIDCLDELFDFGGLSGNTAAQFQIQAALFYMMHGKTEAALERLRRYAAVIRRLFSEENLLPQGDDYFNRIFEWYDGCDLGSQPPRDRKVVHASALQVFGHPAFAPLAALPEFEKIRKSLENLQSAGARRKDLKKTEEV